MAGDGEEKSISVSHLLFHRDMRMSLLYTSGNCGAGEMVSVLVGLAEDWSCILSTRSGYWEIAVIPALCVHRVNKIFTIKSTSV